MNFSTSRVSRDGTDWELSIVYADKEIRSQGSNSFPLHDGTESGDLQKTGAFAQFVMAVQSLVGGRDFN